MPDFFDHEFDVRDGVKICAWCGVYKSSTSGPCGIITPEVSQPVVKVPFFILIVDTAGCGYEWVQFYAPTAMWALSEAAEMIGLPWEGIIYARAIEN